MNRTGGWPAVLMVPGMQCTEEVFTELRAGLRARMPGIDIRDHRVTADTVAAAALDLTAALDRPTVLIGHSLGGTVAMAAARLDPNWVAGLVCLCANPRNPIRDQRRDWLHLRDRTRRVGLPPMGPTVNRWISRGPSDGTPGAVRRHAAADRTCRRMAAEVGADGLIAQLGVQLSRIDERPGLARFGGPVLAVAADTDTLVDPKATAEIAAAAPHGRFVRIHGDHMAPLTSPDPVTEVVADWMTDRFVPVPTH